MKLAVFASGSGSNFEALLAGQKKGIFAGTIELLVCDKKDAYAIKRAENHGIPSLVLQPKDFPTKAEYEAEILSELERLNIDLIILAGYMRLIGPTLLQAYKNRIINIHPSLLPSFPGLDAIGQAWDAGVKVTGVTIHYVDEGMDTGPIIAQDIVRISETDTKETLQKNIQKVEHELYPKTIASIIQKEKRGV